jgi:hypothetical protein
MTPSTRRLVILAGGAVLGGCLVISPVAILFCALLVLLVVLACRPLSGLERRVVLAILLVSIALRVAAVAALFLTAEPHHLTMFPFEGDGLFLKQRSLWIRNIWLGVPTEPFFFSSAFIDYGWSGYIYLIAYIQYLLSPAPYAIHLLNVCCAISAAALVHRLVRAAYGPLPALIALVVMLFLPTQIMWSVSALRDSLFQLLLVVIAGAAALAVTGTRWVVRVCGIAALVVAVPAVDAVREGGVAIAALALAMACAGTFVVRRPYVLLLALLLLSPAALRLLDAPAVQERLLPRLRTAGQMHIGHVRTTGHGYKLLDQRFYTFVANDLSNPIGTMTWPEAERFALRAMRAFWVVPTPGQVVSRSELLFLPQQIIWYALLALAALGIVQGCRGHVFGTWLAIGMACAGSIAVGLNSGNIGTLVRHRDSIVPFVACLSGLGAASILSWLGLVAQGSAPLRPIRRREWLSRVFESSTVARFVTRVTRGSFVYAAITGLLRPSIGYRAEGRIGGPIDPLLERLGRIGSMASLLRRMAAQARDAWDNSRAGAISREVLALEFSERLRLAGHTLLVALLIAGAAAPFADFEWPALIPWLAACAGAIVLSACASPLAVAWRYRRAPVPSSTSG